MWNRQNSAVFRWVIVGMVVVCLFASESESKDTIKRDVRLHAKGEPRKYITLGSTDAASGFKLELELDSLGAGIRIATLNDPNSSYADVRVIDSRSFFHRPVNAILCAIVIGVITVFMVTKRSALAAYCSNDGGEVGANLQPAGFWIRVAAFSIDGLIFIPITILHFLNILSIKSTILLVPIIVLPALVYTPFMHSFYGATLGKMACGLKVIDGSGKKLTLRAAYLRFLPWLILSLMGLTGLLILFSSAAFESASTMADIRQLRGGGRLGIIDMTLCFFMLADCIVLAFTHRKRAIHDMMARSFCVYKGQQQELFPPERSEGGEE